MKMKIRGSETLDMPQGVIVTRSQAERIAKRDMPGDLRAAGFSPCVTAGERGWNIMYGKAVTGHRTYSGKIINLARCDAGQQPRRI